VLGWEGLSVHFLTLLIDVSYVIVQEKRQIIRYQHKLNLACKRADNAALKSVEVRIPVFVSTI